VSQAAGTQGRLPGITPTALFTFRVFLMPDGMPSHYEVEGRSPDGALTYFRAQSAGGRVEIDPAYSESKTWFERWLLEAAEDLRQADELLRHSEAPREDSRGSE
jgi:hypothetical protein